MTFCLGDKVNFNQNHLTTHAVVIGMTGSGKTGLGITLLEEALLNNIPIIAIDPKGDLSNLKLLFSEQSSEEFKPWTNDPIGKAKQWKDNTNIKDIINLKDNSNISIYTPGSSAGCSVNILKEFSLPSEEILDDSDLFLEYVSSVTTNLLSLINIDDDNLNSPEFTLLSNILEHVWTNKQSVDIYQLIKLIQNPPINKIGVFDLEDFYPIEKREKFALRLNNLVASPSFKNWMIGDSLDINQMFTITDKVPASIFSISHLEDSERMFFVTLLLNEIVGWMRTQSGSNDLKAILYMDEIYGYFPPVANPPSKRPLMTLLKQARAMGLGVVLSSQNPVDLDYKGLANTGTWFLGRMQTERDVARIRAGLERSDGGLDFDLNETIAGLDKREFLLHSVHEKHPIKFKTRHTNCFLKGPMTRSEIKLLENTKVKNVKYMTKTSKVNITPSKPKNMDMYFVDSHDSNAEYFPYLYFDVTTWLRGETKTHIHLLPINPNDGNVDFTELFDSTICTMGENPPEGVYHLIDKDLNYENIKRDYVRWLAKSIKIPVMVNDRINLKSDLGESINSYIKRMNVQLNLDNIKYKKLIRDSFKKKGFNTILKRCNSLKARFEKKLNEEYNNQFFRFTGSLLKSTISNKDAKTIIDVIGKSLWGKDARKQPSLSECNNIENKLEKIKEIKAKLKDYNKHLDCLLDSNIVKPITEDDVNEKEETIKQQDVFVRQYALVWIAKEEL